MTIQNLRHRKSHQEFDAEFEKEEQQKELERTAPIRRATQQLSRAHGELLVAENHLACQELMTRPDNSELAKRAIEFDPANYVGKSAEEMQSLIRDAFLKAKLNIEAKGYRLQPTFNEKVKQIVMNNRSVDVCRAESFEAIFEYGESIGLWTDREVIKPAPVQPAVEETARPEPDIETIDTLSREGAKRARQIVDKQFWKSASPLFYEWIQSLHTHWKFMPTEEQKKQAFNLIEPLNLNPLDRRTYDVLRRRAIAKGIFPPELLTSDEILQRELEEFRVNNPNASPREERIWFARRSKEIEVRITP